jgi:hypothetical protein
MSHIQVLYLQFITQRLFYLLQSAATGTYRKRQSREKNQCDIPHQATTSWPVSRITILSSGSCNTLQSQSRVWLTILTDEDVYELMLEEDAAVVARERCYQ